MQARDHVRRAALCVVAMSTLAACGGRPRIDATDAEACTTSMKAVATQMTSSADSAAFGRAMLEIVGKTMMSSLGASLGSMFSGLNDDAPSVSAPSLDSSEVSLMTCKALGGLNGRQIVAGADSLASVLASRLEEAGARKYLAALEKARSRMDMVADSLGGFEIASAKLTQQSGFVGLEATIELHVRNGTNHPVSRAYFSAVAASSGRTVPWLQEEFNHSIPGGLEPGEKAVWRLQPNMFQGEWSTVRVPPDATFTVRVTRLDGPAGEALWGGPTFTNGDQRLLDSLSTRFGGVGG